MSVKTVHDIRKSFLEFFRQKGHLILPSASLLPAGDPTLLFTTAGMVPFKDYFSGLAQSPSPRIATVQKCFRTTDLDSVGRTKRHLSFFEMLGNFSFGDYFKKEAIEFAWEYTTCFLPFPSESIWVSVYEEDDEAYEIWTKHIGIPQNRVVRLGKEDNFWGPAGETGPCGPCSELYLDRGASFGNETAPGQGGERFLEFWNLVFNQYDFDGKTYLPLKNKGIDTGAGLERLATLVQGVDSVFDTDELKILRRAVEKHLNITYTGENIASIRVIVDHIRALTFAISDGIYPSNESRGYVLRRLLRRALLFARKLGKTESKLYELVDTVVALYGNFYPELKQNKDLAKDFLKREEERFLLTLEAGSQKLEEILQKAEENYYSGKIIPGKEIFMLYDTYGFPVEITKEILAEKGYSLDLVGFQEALEEQKNRSRLSFRGTVERLPVSGEKTLFTGYENFKEEAKIQALVFSENQVSELSQLDLGETEFYLIADKTCFYPEGGGQLADTGTIEGPTGSCEVVDVQKKGDLIIHICQNLQGRLSVGDKVTLKINEKRRQSLAIHHSATHLLNGALRRFLGNHVRQSGSLVHPDYLRFDFTHPSALSLEEMEKIEAEVNQAIFHAIPVVVEELPKEEAEKRGALATFGEKYGSVVRIVGMGKYSLEFCGGTHVKNTRDINLFLLAKQQSVGAGNRRLEAYAGEAALKQIRQLETKVENELQKFGNEIGEIKKEYENLKLNTNLVQYYHSLEKILQKMDRFIQQQKKLEKKEKSKKISFSEEFIEKIFQNKKEKDGIPYCIFYNTGWDIPTLQQLADKLRSEEPNCIYYLGSIHNQSWFLVVATTKSFAEKKNIDILQEFLLVKTQYSLHGGGRKEMVQIIQKEAKNPEQDFMEFLNNFWMGCVYESK